MGSWIIKLKPSPKISNNSILNLTLQTNLTLMSLLLQHFQRGQLAAVPRFHGQKLHVTSQGEGFRETTRMELLNIQLKASDTCRSWHAPTSKSVPKVPTVPVTINSNLKRLINCGVLATEGLDDDQNFHPTALISPLVAGSDLPSLTPPLHLF